MLAEWTGHSRPRLPVRTQAEPSAASPAQRSQHRERRVYVDQQGSAWVVSGLLLAVGAALPALAVSQFSGEIASATAETRALVVLAEDLLFLPTATAFLFTGEVFGRQRHPWAVPYAGPFIDVDDQQTVPAFFKPYVVSLPLVFGTILPIVAGAYLTTHDKASLSGSTIGVYLLIVIAQLLSEGIFLARGSAMWCQVPQVYQTYRIWQLARGCWLASLVGDSAWLQLLQEGLIMLWVFNFGAVMTWTPWMHRWHMQPPQESKSD